MFAEEVLDPPASGSNLGVGGRGDHMEDEEVFEQLEGTFSSPESARTERRFSLKCSP
jgi:hypothetical protein